MSTTTRAAAKRARISTGCSRCNGAKFSASDSQQIVLKWCSCETCYRLSIDLLSHKDIDDMRLCNFFRTHTETVDFNLLQLIGGYLLSVSDASFMSYYQSEALVRFKCSRIYSIVCGNPSNVDVYQDALSFGSLNTSLRIHRVKS